MPKPPVRFSKIPVFRSDVLRPFLDLLDIFPTLRVLIGEVLRFLVVLDASQVQAELRWRLGSRRDPCARSALHELIEAGIVIPVAPCWLKTEIEEDLSKIATELGVPLAKVEEEWAKFETLIRYYRPSEMSTNSLCPDPKDLPYLQTHDQIRADFIWTRDLHFVEANPPDMSGGLDARLREYARATSVLVGAKVGSGFVLVCGFEAITALCKAIADMIRRMPPALQIILGLMAAAFLIHPQSREKIFGWLKDGLAFVERAKPFFLTLAEDFAEATIIAQGAEKTIRAAIPPLPLRRVPAVVVARQVCLRAGEPLSLSEIESRVIRAGYSTRSRTFSAYLKRILRANHEFVEVSAGLWMMGAA